MQMQADDQWQRIVSTHTERAQKAAAAAGKINPTLGENEQRSVGGAAHEAIAHQARNVKST